MLVQDTADHRSSQRFSLRLAVKCLRAEPLVTLERASIGESVNLSSTGLLFKTTEALLPGQLVKASIDWPARLDHRVRLTLDVEGPVVRKAGDHIAMRIEKYGFRTRGAAEWAVGGGCPADAGPPLHNSRVSD
jgi:PilZ domain